MAVDARRLTGRRDRWSAVGGRQATWGRYAFPVLVLLAVVVLVAFGVSGTSTGVLWQYLFGQQPDPHLLLGAPRGIRSDEWLVSTPMMIAQDRAGLPEVNTSLSEGLNVSLIYGAPYQDWSTLFRPETWGFFVLPLEQAFALRWWVVKAVLALAAYAFVLLLMPGHRLLAAAVSVGLVAAPFLAWWAGPGVDGLLGYALVAMACVILLLRGETSRWRVAGLAVVLGYVLACFGLALYPPYQLPVALVVVGFCLGWLAMQRRSLPGQLLLVRLGVIGLSLLAAAGVVGAFLATRSDVVAALAGTAYPGDRVVRAGSYTLSQLFFGFLTPFLQLPSGTLDGGALAAVGGNRSEASAFVLVGLLLTAVQVWLLVSARRAGLPLNHVLTGLLAVQALFLGHLFLVAFDRLSAVLLLQQVPYQRMQIGLGLLSTLQFIVVAWEMRRREVRAPLWLALTTGVVSLLLMLEVGARLTPDGLATPWSALTIVALALAVASLPVLIARGHQEVAALGLAAFCVLSSGAVNPLYRGLLTVPETSVGRAVAEADQRRPGGWVATGDIVLNAVLVESGVKTYSGAFSYPVAGAWSELDPTGRFRDVYNRYAHVVFVPGLTGDPLQNPQADVVLAALDGCAAFAQGRLAHVLSGSAIADPCLQQKQVVSMPGRDFYLYDVVPPATS